MDKEMLSFVAIGLMFLANAILLLARKLQKRWVSRVLTLFAFLLLFPTFLLILAVIL
ncbi:hypothetical protein BSNK01_00860 [Bacillaceae bacterium]